MDSPIPTARRWISARDDASRSGAVGNRPIGEVQRGLTRGHRSAGHPEHELCRERMVTGAGERSRALSDERDHRTNSTPSPSSVAAPLSQAHAIASRSHSQGGFAICCTWCLRVSASREMHQGRTLRCAPL